jgi:hypothetical protein
MRLLRALWAWLHAEPDDSADHRWTEPPEPRGSMAVAMLLLERHRPL